MIATGFVVSFAISAGAILVGVLGEADAIVMFCRTSIVLISFCQDALCVSTISIEPVPIG